MNNCTLCNYVFPLTISLGRYYEKFFIWGVRSCLAFSKGMVPPPRFHGFMTAERNAPLGMLDFLKLAFVYLSKRLWKLQIVRLWWSWLFFLSLIWTTYQPPSEHHLLSKNVQVNGAIWSQAIPECFQATDLKFANRLMMEFLMIAPTFQSPHESEGREEEMESESDLRSTGHAISQRVKITAWIKGEGGTDKSPSQSKNFQWQE